MNNPRFDRNEADRRLAGMLGMGKVVEVDLATYSARVQDGDLVTGWLRMGMMRALGDQMTWPYKVGEEVAYATLSGDGGVGFIICALPNGQATANSTAGVLRANADGGFDLTGDITLTGSLTASGDVVAGSVSLQQHTHPGDSGGVTGAPL